MDIPQVVAIVKVQSGNKVSFKKDVRSHVKSKTGPFYVQMNGEILLTSENSSTSNRVEITGNRMILPEQIARGLSLENYGFLAMIQRDAAVALKAFELKERQVEYARVLDIESPLKLVRVAETNPEPAQVLATLQQYWKGTTCRYDVRGFLKNNPTLEAWRARKLLDAIDPNDAALRKQLIRERCEQQKNDGSWNDDLVCTSRNLRELIDLGIEPDNTVVQRAVKWLLQRPQSKHNPGMFFLQDHLVAEQARIIEQREQGNKLRFRERKSSELRRARFGLDLTRDPCGPRIMWPTAFALEPLLRLGYEERERIRDALTMLLHGSWCECGYQHGRNWEEPLSPDALSAVEQQYKSEYRYGGIESLAELAKMDLTKKVGLKMMRVSEDVKNGTIVYELEMPNHQQACELVTVWALSAVKDTRLRKLVEAHLWRFAARQYAQDGHFHQKHVGPYFYLDLFSRYDCPVSKVAIMRSLPWILDTQNQDGSWGDGQHNEAPTLAIVRALQRVMPYVPKNII